MKFQLDIRSMLIGIVLTICCFLVSGAARSSNPYLNARFQLTAAGQNGNAYIIDTTTGQVWERYPGNDQNAINFRKPKIENTPTEENINL